MGIEIYDIHYPYHNDFFFFFGKNSILLISNHILMHKRPKKSRTFLHPNLEYITANVIYVQISYTDCDFI